MSRPMRTARVGVLVSLALLLVPSSGHAPAPAISALAPVELVISGGQELVGAVVTPDGTLYVSDRGAGVVYRLAPGGPLTVAIPALDRPAGLALDPAGRLLVAEEHAGRVLRVEPDGHLTVLASGIKTPRWLAASADGSVYISAHRLTAPDGPDPSEGREILRLGADGSLTVVATGIRRLEGLVRLNGALVAATKGLESGPDSAGKLLRFEILPGGTLAGPVEWVNTGLKQPVGLGLDVLSALYVSSKELAVEQDPAKRAIGKVHPDVHLTVFAENLDDPQGLALGPDGSLYAADGRSGRLLRFVAPAPPTLDPLPDFTKDSPFTLTGHSEGGARIDAFANEGATAASTLADGTGAFAVALPLEPDGLNRLEVFATAQAGNGLTSAPATATLTHDGTPPSLTFLDPPGGGVVRQAVTVRVQASDGGSDVASVELTAGGSALGSSLTPTPPAPSVTATADWNTAGLDGDQTLTATARDRAANTTTISRAVVVDNLPPDTLITSGPSGEIAETSASFTFTGTDTRTAVADLQFAWRLDGGPWSAFSPVTMVSVSGLGEGAHTFEVKARDLAGNEDPTPAGRLFSVRLGPSITGVDPASGPVGTLVTITGDRFEPGATTVAFNGVAAVIRTATPTVLTTTVPPGATSGLLTVTTSRGTASRTFTVTTTGDFSLSAVPGQASVLQGGQATYALMLTGTGTFTGLASLVVTGLPAGLTAALDPAQLAPGQRGTLTLQASSTAVLASSSFTLTATATVDGVPRTQTVPLMVDVVPGARTALVGRFLTVEGEPIPGIVLRLATQQTQTDAAGAFLLLDVPDGTQTLSIDANAARPGYPIYAVDVGLAAGQTTGLPTLRITPPPPAERFTPIDNASQDQIVTDARYPGLALTLPAGVTVVGWDGQVKTRVALERLDPDRLPVPPPQFVPRSLYQIFFGTPMGGLPSAPLPVTLPNDMDLSPGQKTELWYYDAAPFAGIPAGWRFAGLATVSEDGTRIVSDPGVGLERFCGVCGIVTCFPERPNYNPDGDHDGEPVSLALGQQIVTKTDLLLPGRLPVGLHRTYNPFEQFGFAGFELPLGPGWALSIDVVLIEFTASLRRLIMPGNARYDFVRQPDGTFVNLTHPRWAGAVMTAEANGVHRLRLKDGTGWRFATGWQPRGAGNLTGLGLLISQTDRYGTAVTLSRDAFGTLTRISGPGGALDLIPDSAGRRIAEVRDPIGRTVRYGYNAAGRLETVTDPAGGVTSYTYNAFGGILTITDPRGITFVTHEYDANGRVARQIQADGGVWVFEYQFATTAAGSGSAAPAAPVMVADVSPVTATDAGRAIHVAQGGVTVPPPTPVFAMPTRVVVTNPRGFSTTYRLSPNGFTSEIIDTLGQATRFERDASGQITATIDPLGRVTRYDYDAAGNIIRITDPAGNVRFFTFEPAFNRIASVTDPLGQVTRFEYDGHGNLTAIIDPTGARTALAYDGFGQPISLMDPLGHTSLFEYGATGNLTGVVDSLGHRTTREYDTVARLVRLVDALGRTTMYGYDSLNRLTEVSDALHGATRFTYDQNGNLLTITDARAMVTAHTYDVMDRLATRTDSILAVERFEYDRLGNIVRYTDRKSQVSTLTYDARDRLVHSVYADGTTVTFAHDAAGRLVEATDAVSGTITNTYDLLDRQIAQTTTLGTIQYQYDHAGRRTGMEVPGQPPIAYGYDAANRLTQILQGTELVTLQYDLAGRRTRLTLPNQVSTEYRYDAASRLTALLYRNATGPLGDLVSQYDPVGNRIAVGGNFARTRLPDPVATASYDAANRQLAVGDKTLTYDANGNLTTLNDSGGTTTLNWDARNRLIGLTGPGVTASFTYDPLGRRAAKTIAGVRTDFLYDGVNAVQELADGGVGANLLRGLGIDELLVRSGPTAIEVLLTDALDSTVALTDVTATVTTEYSYEAFGRTTVLGTPSTNAWQFTGRENDGTGLYYYRARYLHPGLARFISEDPLECERRKGLNLYAYVFNNPINLADPSGLSPGVGPGACIYYDLQCGPRSKSGASAPYVCRAGPCCRDFGNGPGQNCVRECLIRTHPNCVPPRIGVVESTCVFVTHVQCYVTCRFVPATVPDSCWNIALGR